MLRNVLISEPLHVEQYLHNHHDEDVQDTSTAAAGLGSHSANRVAALMTAFPDIIKVSDSWKAC